MATTARTHASARNAAPVATSALRDGAVALAGLALIGGLYLDGWAHIHRPGLETFFTPWHGVLYSGFLLLAAALVMPVLRGRLRGVAWSAALPAGYGLALLGVALFGAGGLLDLGWHIVFGIEAGTEALLSPPHLLLATGAGLMVTAPLRSAWSLSDAPQRWTTWLPPLLSLALLLALLGFFTSYAHPFARTAAAASARPVSHSETHSTIDQAVTAILLQTGVLSGGVWWTPTLIFGAVALAAITGWLVSYLVFSPFYEA